MNRANRRLCSWGSYRTSTIPTSILIAPPQSFSRNTSKPTAKQLLEPKLPIAYCQETLWVNTSPAYLFSGLLKCQSCGGAVILISGKGSGYFGCYNARQKTCHNTLLLPRKRIKGIIIKELREKLLTAENLEYVFKNIEKLAAEGLNEVPELVQKKKAQLDKLKGEIQNYMNFIRSGNISKTVSEALSDAEKKDEELKQELSALEFQKERTFKSPPKEWINHRLERLNETLNKDTVASFQALKELL